MPTRGRLLLAALLLVAAAACGGDGEEGLPPEDDAGLAEVFQPLFDPLGVEFTYGSVVDVEGGKHLALYVEPTGPATDEQYLARLLDASAAIVPFLFDAYPGLHSFDLCQEPVPTGPDDPAQPEPRTVVQLTRAQAATVDDWSTVGLADLIRASRAGEGGDVRVDDAIARLPGWTSAVAEVEAPSGRTR